RSSWHVPSWRSLVETRWRRRAAILMGTWTKSGGSSSQLENRNSRGALVRRVKPTQFARIEFPVFEFRVSSFENDLPYRQIRSRSSGEAQQSGCRLQQQFGEARGRYV